MQSTMKIRVQSLLIAVAIFAGVHNACAADDDLSAIKVEIAKRHDEAVKRLQNWIRQVSIAAENRGYPAGAEYMAKLARDAGFQYATVIHTDGKPGVFATLDTGAPKSVGLYFMYDVKQFDPAEWTSPPTEARIVDKPSLGKVMVGRGAVDQKGPEAAVLRRCMPFEGPVERCRSIWCWWPKAKRKLVRRIFPCSSGDLRCWQLSGKVSASSCPPPPRIWTEWSR